MKNSILALLASAAASTALAAPVIPVQNQLTYLGGAFNLGHCSQLAGAAGFQLATFGGYYNGVYLVNGCFGSNRNGGGNGNYVVTLAQGHRVGQCANSIEDTGADIVRTQGNQIYITATNGLLRSIRQLECVYSVQ